MPLWEAAQLLLGFAIPFLLVKHVVDARLARELYGAESDYAFVLWQMRSNGWNYVLQVTLLIVAWAHGCIGIHY
jgi:adenylate cyclase